MTSARSAAMPSTQAFPLQTGWKRGDPLEALLEREWLVTNGLGGYASGTIGGACTRRFHGKLIAALPSPHGRFMMLNHLEEIVTLGDGRSYRLSGDDAADQQPHFPDPELLDEFVLEAGLPVWRYSAAGIRLEKRVAMPHLQNTTCILYRLIDGPPGTILSLRPSLRFRPHDGALAQSGPESWTVRADGEEIEIADETGPATLRLIAAGMSRFDRDESVQHHRSYRIERMRGYDHEGPMGSPGVIHLALERDAAAGLVASVEPWATVRALTLEDCFGAEAERRTRLLAIAGPAGRHNTTAQLALAADQFLVSPGIRSADDARLRASGDEPRTVIAGYHWFTDWGRDTMISLEGLTLATGRHREAGNILRTFASYIRDGLIPNLFPERDGGGLYHTADATLWFFHAVRRYVDVTGDRETLRALLPKLSGIIDHHLAGTRFNIAVDPADGLLHQGAEGYQLTWMDAKVDGWVVTPRRGKAVEINALFYNALRILQQFLTESGAGAERLQEHADRLRESFNRRFWFAEGGYLYDVVDAEGGGNDAALRPNQIFALSLDYPVLDRERWRSVVDTVRRELVTPVGLRSLARAHPDYKSAYEGDLRARDAAYHQGTVWGWLIGPFIDAWMRAYPEDRSGALAFLDGFRPHLGDACIGTISEVFDAEAPHHPRGCASQAWSVAEVLRCLRALS